jgi:hypothetical protein
VVPPKPRKPRKGRFPKGLPHTLANPGLHAACSELRIVFQVTKCRRVRAGNPKISDGHAGHDYVCAGYAGSKVRATSLLLVAFQMADPSCPLSTVPCRSYPHIHPAQSETSFQKLSSHTYIQHPPGPEKVIQSTARINRKLGGPIIGWCGSVSLGSSFPLFGTPAPARALRHLPCHPQPCCHTLSYLACKRSI